MNKNTTDKRERFDCLKHKKVQILFLIMISIGITVAYISLCFNVNIWTDEAFTIDLLNNHNSFKSIMEYTATDVHPPLYYWILKCFTDVFGVRFGLIKILSVLPMLLLFLLGSTFIYKRLGFWNALFFIMMVGAIPCTMEYAVQMRMYAWCMLFVTGTAIFAFDAWENGKKSSYILMGFFGVCAAYSHYFAFVAIIWIYAFLLIGLLYGIGKKQREKKELMKYGAVICASLLLYIPWMPYLIGQIRGVAASYWIPDITKEVIRGYFDWIFQSDYPGIKGMFQILFAVIFIWLMIRMLIKRTREDFIALLAVVIPALVVTTGVIASKLIRPVFIIRYIMPCVPLLCLFFAVMLSKTDKKVRITLFVWLMLVILMDYKCTYYDEYQATDTDKTLSFLEENVDHNDLIVYNYAAYDFIYQCYFDNNQLKYIGDINYNENCDRMWFLCTVYQPMPDQNMLEENGWKMTYIGDFGIEQNEFWIYEIAK